MFETKQLTFQSLKMRKRFNIAQSWISIFQTELISRYCRFVKPELIIFFYKKVFEESVTAFFEMILTAVGLFLAFLNNHRPT